MMNAYFTWVKVCLSICCLLFSSLAMAETEPNNLFSQANVVEIGASVDGSLSTEAPADTLDCYSFTTSSDGYFVFAVVPTSDLNVAALLYDADQNRILGAKNEKGNGENEGVVYPNLRGGTYYAVVKVPNAVSSSAGDYTATFSFNPVDKIDQEPNDVFNTANELVLGSNTSGNLGYHGDVYTDKVDMYMLQVAQNGSLSMTLEPDGTLNASLAMYDSNRIYNTVYEDRKGKGEVESFEFNNLAAGTYFIEIAAREGFGSYNITSQFEPAVNAPANTDDIASALPLFDGTQTVGTVQGQLGFLGNQVRDDIDYYTFTTSAYGKVNLQFSMDFGDNLNLYYELYDQSLRLLDDRKGDDETFSELNAGTYYLRVQRDSGYGSYTLTGTFEGETPPEQYAIPDTTIAPNGTVTDILVDEDHAQHWYAITLPENGLLTVKANFTAEGNVWTNLRRVDEKSGIENVNNYYTADARSFTVENMRQGTYLIEVSRSGGATTGSISTEFTPVTKIDNEPNDDYVSLAPVALNASYDGNIGYEGNGWRDELDSYLLDIKDDGYIEINLTAESTANIWTGLYDLSGKSITRVDHFNNYYTEDIKGFSKRNLPAGQYVVYISRSGGYSSYTLDVNFTPNRSNDSEQTGDDWSAATEITLGEGYVGHLGYNSHFYDDNQDLYTFTLPQDGYFHFHFKGEDTANIWCNLYYEDGMTKVEDTNAYYRDSPVGITETHLEAGTYYLQIWRSGGDCTYQFFTTFTPQQHVDAEPNDPVSMATPVQLDTVVQGHMGYDALYAMDTEDWYSFDIPADGTYKISYHSYKQANYWFNINHGNMVSELRDDNRYYRSDQWTHEMEFTAGTYYLQVARTSGWGPYAFSIGSPDTVTTGIVTGTVKSDTNFPLPEIEVEILGHEFDTTTDFLGQYTFENLTPGTYTLALKSGAKYYPVEKEFTVNVGETTTVDVVMRDGNKTAPADVEHFYGLPDNHFIHLFWSPSVSPDVSTGGGYNLYINGGAAIDLGDVLTYRSLEFENGVEYTLRLTVYDQYGNESQGKTLTIIPSGEGPIYPTPTPVEPRPTPTVTPTPTQTLPPDITPTPTVEQPADTPTPTDVPQGPTPTPTEVPAIEPAYVYEFGASQIADSGWADNMLGGFSGNPPGFAKTGMPALDPLFPHSLDQKALMLSVRPVVGVDQADEVCFFYCLDRIETQGMPVLVVATVQAESANANAAMFVGMLKGTFTDPTTLDASIAFVSPKNSVNFTEPKRIVCLYQPDGGVNVVSPFVQVAASEDGGSATVYVDRVEVYLLNPAMPYPGHLFDMSY